MKLVTFPLNKSQSKAFEIHILQLIDIDQKNKAVNIFLTVFVTRSDLILWIHTWN